MCSRGWTNADAGKRWHWQKENKNNKFCNKGFNGNTAICAGAWCKGCPTNLHRATRRPTRRRRAADAAAGAARRAQHHAAANPAGEAHGGWAGL